MLLAIETATPQVGVALWDGDGPVTTWILAGGRRHGEALAPAIARALADAGITPSGLSAVVVDVGPGLFTGLRVGLATAKALVAALDLPAVGIGSLDVLAHGAAAGGATGLVAAVVDARRQEVFRAVYSVEEGRVGEVAPAAVVAPDGLAAELAALAGEGGGAGGQVRAVGDGALRYARLLAPAGGRVVIGDPLAAHPDVAVLARLGAAAVAAGAVTDAAGLAPRYLRAADVKIGWARRGSSGPVAGEPAVASRG